MRILVLSDLHANATAFAAALDSADGRWDVSVCLGDVVGYGPDPHAVVARLRELGTQTIRGNHDKAVAGLMDTTDFNPVAKAAVDWTRSQLNAEDLAWLSALPHGPLATDGIVLVHGAFQDEDEYVFTPAQALDGLLDSSAEVTFFGHTHHQGGFSYQDSNLEVLQIRPRASESFSALRIEEPRRYLLNPARSASRATVIHARALPSPTSNIKPWNSGACPTTFPQSKNACEPPAFPNL